MSIEMAPIQSIIIYPRRGENVPRINTYFIWLLKVTLALLHRIHPNIYPRKPIFFVKNCAEREKKNAKIVRKYAKKGDLVQFLLQPAS